MQHNLITTMRSLKIVDGCKSAAQVYSALNTSLNPCAGTGEDKLQQDPYRANSLRSKSMQSTSLSELLSAYGIPVADLIEPQIEPYLKSVDFSQTLADIYRRLEAASQCEKSLVHLEQASFFRGLSDPKLLRRSLRCARQHAIDVHSKVVLAAWLRFERREDELVGSSSMDCGVGRILECPKSSLVHGYDPGSVYDPCPCRQPAKNEESSSPAETASVDVEEGEGGGGEEEGKELEVVGEGELEEEMAPSTSAEECDVSFCIGDDEVKCIRYNIASLSRPLMTMLYGGFAESRREMVNFSNIGISVKGMEAIEAYSRTNKLDSVTPQIVLELLYFADKFCCDELKSACDAYLASLVYNIDDAFKLIEYGLEETAYLLVASCLQVFLRELPGCLYKSEVMKYFCEPEARKRLDEAGNASFTLYYFLSQVAMEEDMKSNTTVMLLERLGECAAEGWQKALALHQLGCVMLERQEYKDAQHWFEASAQSGHVYSLVGVARSKFKRGHKYLAYKQMNSLISEYKPIGWMYQERSLYCNRKEKMMDLHSASSMDPTLLYPYKYRACLMVEEHKIGAAISEISKIIGFRVSPDCLELRAWCSILLEDYEGALRDIRALLTLDPNYMVFHGKVHGDHIVDLIRKNVEHERTGPADCWIQLYDRWSSVDDIGSLAVVHQMLAYDPCKSLLRFRQSLLLLRLNCQKAAMRSLRLARNHSNSEHERLVYEGWILYDTGHREEALAKAEESISIQRSFEAYFLKAYALADTSLDADASAYVIQLLQQALKCASDGLRKGQALNNLGSVYVDCEKLDLAEDCYRNALNIRHTRAHQGLARVYHLKNNKKCAYDEMTKLIEKARNNASAYEKRSEYCERDMARSDLTMATQLDPLRTYPYRYRAAVLMDDHKEAEAIAELSKAIMFKPDLQLLQLRAAFYESIGDTTSTVRDCEAALCIDPNHMETLDLYNKARDQVLTPQPKK